MRQIIGVLMLLVPVVTLLGMAVYKAPEVAALVLVTGTWLAVVFWLLDS